MRNLFLILTLLFAVTASAADIAISSLPLGNAATSSIADSFPYVSTATNVTKRLSLYDISNIPTLVSTYATKLTPSFSGSITFSSYGLGLIHSSSGGLLTSSLLVNADVSGVAALARSKLASGTAYRLLVNDSSGVMSELGPLTNGQLLIGSTGAAATPAVISGTANQVVVTSGAGSITLSTPQNISTTSTPTFAGITSTSGNDFQNTTRFRMPFTGDLSGDATTGSLQTLATVTTPIVRLTSGTLISIAGVPAGGSGQFLVVMNATGVALSVQNDSGSATAANRIYTGTGGNFTLNNNATVFLLYDNTATHWRMIGGGGSGRSSGTFTGTSITPTSGTTDETFLYTGGSSQAFSTTGFGTISSLTNGYKCTIIGADDTNTLSIADSDVTNGRLMNGNIELGKGQSITFEYNSTLARMVEISRSF